MKQQQQTKQQSSTSTSTLKTATRRLSDKHYREWVEDRGLSRAWVEANIYSVSTEVASSLLGYPAKSSGVWIEGANLEGQFRPDKPWRSKDQKGKAPKYRRTYALTERQSCALAFSGCTRFSRMYVRIVSLNKVLWTSYQLLIKFSILINSNWMKARIAQKM